ncbi:hypothetical protein GH714_000320 [Hevea brasiliensis]|uniref:Dof-type domain-containing protein n=1 Tax=Hevea brasiliensis TaxID=3981 RepID=A0A6A6L7K7_HEVBR|nr:hypothetical protein GH714_000320 [Hevea brasiliensis]
MLTSDQMFLHCPPRPLPMERKWKSHVEFAPNCPRCASSNTKFCYYNNYSFSQPRAKSLRISQDGRNAFAKNFSGFGGRSNESSGDSLAQETATNDGSSSEIDIAVVFAKFLNQDSSFQPEFMAMSQELPNEAFTVPANSLTPDSAVIECDDKLTDLIQESDLFLKGYLR